MSAFDTMPADDLERRLSAWMGEQRPDADLTSTYDTIVDATRKARQRPWFLVRRGIRRTTPITERRFLVERVAMAALVLLLIALMLAAGLLVGSRLQHPDVTPLPPLPAALAIDYAGNPKVGTLYTSSVFGQPTTFKLTARNPGEPSTIDVCPVPSTTPRWMVFAHPMGCHDELQFIRPWAVACGPIGDHPDADHLATAILAIPPATVSTDLGDLTTPGAVPPGMFGNQYHGRVVEMVGSGPAFDASVVDPNECRLLPEPGSKDPTVEIRGDIGALFVLVDVDGELVVIRAFVAGYDALTNAGAQARGLTQGDEEVLRHLLGLVTDVRFGQRLPPQEGSLPP